jgi:(+)-trans-carveol dehydrogenase
MMAKLSGKVALITGAARGQGQRHAERMAAEGADIIAIDLCADIDTVPYPLADEAGLEATAKLVREHGRRVVTRIADVRDYEALERAIDEGVGELGGLDIVVANAGVTSFATARDLPLAEWRDVIDVNLSGAYYTARAAIPHLVERASGGSIILISSALAHRAMPNLPHYVASKAGLVGLMRALALELSPQSIRVNSLHPSVVDTEMVQNSAMYALFRPDLADPTRDDLAVPSAMLHLMPTPWVDREDVTNAVLFLASDEARFVTGQELRVDAGSVLL